jgi:hypothetical protein
MRTTAVPALAKSVAIVDEVRAIGAEIGSRPR